MLRRLLLIGLAGLLAVREVLHLSEPFWHNQIDTFLDVFVGFSVLLLIANAFGFRRIWWSRTIGPCLAALLVLPILTRLTLNTPGFRMAEWAETSPWRGFKPRVFFVDIDPWLILQADLLVFTTAFSLILICGATIRARWHGHAKAA